MKRVQCSYLASTATARTIAVLIALSPLLSAACSNRPSGEADGGPTADATAGVTVDEACSQSAMANCQQLATCTAQNLLVVRYGDVATCQMRQQASCVAALGAPRTSNSPDHVASCTTTVASESCADFINDATTTKPGCTIAPGGLAMGAACGVSGQCQSSYCSVPDNAVCGTCTAPPAPDDPCPSAISGGCGPGLECDPTSLRCVKPGLEGGPCDKDHFCGLDLFCARTGTTDMGTCQPSATTPGAACDSTGATAPACDSRRGLYCPRMTGACEVVKYVTGGEPCGVLGDGNVAVCEAGGLCVKASGAVMGVCAAPAGDAEACDSANGPPCLLPARCVAPAGATAGVCTLPAPASCH